MFANILLIVTTLFAIGAYVWQNLPRNSLITTHLNSSYHYIIIGGGTAGCVLANRLSEDPDVKVLLVEAGYEDNERQIAEIPLAALELQRKELDWSYTIEPQRNACLSFENNQLLWPSGKALGGSSLISYLIYSRGNPHDYESWKNSGCNGWGYEDVLPYFIKAENHQNKIFAETEYHGTNGPMPVSSVSPTPLSSTFLMAGWDLGYKQTDYTSEKQLGISNAQANILRGSRQSTAGAYLRPILNRPNLHVATHAYVKKINIKHKRAVGIEVIRNDTIFTIQARAEVILAAGTVGSSKLLQLSGVGPRDHLENLSIPVIQDLPVGNNLQDHVYPFGLQFGINVSISATEQTAKTLMSLMNYLMFGEGFLSTSGFDSLGFFKSNVQPEDAPQPYLELQLRNSLFTTIKEPENRKSLRKTFNMREKVFQALFEDVGDKHGFQLIPGLLHPKSVGIVRLNSSHYRDAPIIDPRYLSDPRDIEVLLHGIRLVKKFVSTASFQAIKAQPLKRQHPECSEDYDTDEYWKCFIRHNLYSMHHPTGTCKMGSAKDTTSVVTPDLRVKGISNLRVVDASIIPQTLSGDPCAAVVMIAEKAADLILGRITVQKRGEGLFSDADEFAEFDNDIHDEL